MTGFTNNQSLAQYSGNSAAAPLCQTSKSELTVTGKREQMNAIGL